MPRDVTPRRFVERDLSSMKRERAFVDALESRVLFAATAAPWLVAPLSSQIITRAITPVVTSLTLINADTDQPVATLPVLSNNAVLDFSTLPTRRLNVRANVGSGVASVKFGYDANLSYRTESGAPFALAANNGTDYYVWTPTLGTHTVRATPYSATNATGIAGAVYSVTFKVVASTPTTVSVQATDASAKEVGGDDGTFTVSRTGSTAQPLTVNLSVSGTATEGTDYDALLHTVIIPAGATWTTLTVHPIDDFLQEQDETVVVRAIAGSGYAVSSTSPAGTVRILDDDRPTAQSPFLGTPFAVPTTAPIEAEAFDVGGDFVSYHVPQSLLTTNAYRPGYLPPIAATTDIAGGFQLDQLPAQTFFEYTVDIGQTGFYDVSVRYAAGGLGGSAHLNVEDVNASGAIPLAPTGGWDQWSDVTATGMELTAGRHVFGLAIDSSADAANPNGPVASLNSFQVALSPVVPPVFTAQEIADASAAPQAAAPVVAAAQVATRGLSLSWNASDPADPARPRQYQITYTPGVYVSGPALQPQTIIIDATASSVQLNGVEPYAIYSIDVAGIDAAGRVSTTHLNTWTAEPANERRYLYAFDLPKTKQGFTTLKPQIEVFDVANGHQWVKNIPLPAGIYNVRGVAASAATHRMYIAYFKGPADGYQPGGLLCMDMITNQVVWKKDFDPAVVPSPDRFALTPDGSKIYMPTSEYGGDRFWVVLDALTGNARSRIYHTSAPHNTNVSVDGTRVFLEGQEKAAEPANVVHTVGVVDTATDTVIQKVGPFRDVIRPYTINGKADLVFATVNNFIGFQIGSVTTGNILFTAAPPGMTQPDPTLNRSHTHGIAMTPDEKEIWVVDTDHVGIHVWNVEGVSKGIAPTYIGFIKTRRTGRDLAGNLTSAASNDTNGVPAWLAASYDGKYIYPESGEIIDVATHKIVGQLRPKSVDSSGVATLAPYTHSRYFLEVDVDGAGVPVRVTNQFAVGRIR